jgi:hypothetical protein
MGARKPPPSTLTAAQRDAAEATLRELAKAVHAMAGDAYLHVDLVADLAALLARLCSRLPAEWGQHASARLTDQLNKGKDENAAAAALLYLQTLIAGALNVPGVGGRLHHAGASAYLASRDLIAAAIAPAEYREPLIAAADARLAAAHSHLAAERRPRHLPSPPV